MGMYNDMLINYMFQGDFIVIFNDVLVSPGPRDILTDVLQIFLKGLVN